MEYQTWSEFVKLERSRSGMTQEEFAALTGVPLGTLRRWEQEVSSPSLSVLRLFNYALGQRLKDSEVIIVRNMVLSLDEITGIT